MNVNINLQGILAQLPEKKKRQFVAHMIEENMNSGNFHVIALHPDMEEEDSFSCPPKADALDIRRMVEEKGMDYVIDMFIDMINCGATSAKLMDSKEFANLIEKCDNGSASPEEEAMCNCVKKGMMTRTDTTIALNHIILDLIKINMTEFGQKTYYLDVTQSVFMLMATSMTNKENTPMHKYKGAHPERIIRAIASVADDMEEALSKSLFKKKKPHNQLLALAFYHLAQKCLATGEGIESKDKMVFDDYQELLDLFEFEVEDEDKENK